MSRYDAREIEIDIMLISRHDNRRPPSRFRGLSIYGTRAIVSRASLVRR